MIADTPYLTSYTCWLSVRTLIPAASRRVKWFWQSVYLLTQWGVFKSARLTFTIVSLLNGGLLQGAASCYTSAVCFVLYNCARNFFFPFSQLFSFILCHFASLWSYSACVCGIFFLFEVDFHPLCFAYLSQSFNSIGTFLLSLWSPCVCYYSVSFVVISVSLRLFDNSL